jgi:hypothetical protein
MALNDFEGELVLVGWFLYDGAVPTRIEIVARDYDVAFHVNEVGDGFEPRRTPTPLGPDGRLYYLRGNLDPHPSLEGVQAWADSQPWGPVDWYFREPAMAGVSETGPSYELRDL